MYVYVMCYRCLSALLLLWRWLKTTTRPSPLQSCPPSPAEVSRSSRSNRSSSNKSANSSLLWRLRQTRWVRESFPPRAQSSNSGGAPTSREDPRRLRLEEPGESLTRAEKDISCKVFFLLFSFFVFSSLLQFFSR